jgi:hypothetical protein
MRAGYVKPPDGWKRVSAEGPGPFVTDEVFRRPNGELVHWHSRRHRKRHATSWWIGSLFAVGSSCFALAAIASEWASASRPGIGVTFFVGSILFTTAAYLQYSEAVNADREAVRNERRDPLRPASWEPKRIDWLACAVQLAGTILFNVSCFLAMQKGLDARQTNLRVWAPDAFGSIAFLVASALALAEVCGRWFCLRGRSLSWRITALNMSGSIAFGVAAVAALVVPSSGDPVSAGVSNVGTAIGALCFLAGGLLLIPEGARAEAAAAPTAVPA